ncbi:Endonuclease V [Clostridium sp. ASBs410]|nr:Endonuclease V [Clostridium sp. ASBs410]
MKNKKEKSNGLEAYYTEIQLDFADKIELFDKIKLEDIKTISGIDLAYWREKGTDYAVCCIVTINYCSKEIVEIKSLTSKIDVPYIPGYLSFRELPLIINTFKMLESNTDLIMFDGNGYLHYRNMGIATHASFYLNKPTIGVAKSYLKINNVDYLMPEDFDGAYTDIIIKDKVHGRVVRTHKGVKPIFVSCGNWITLDTSTNIVLNLIDKDSRQPLPTRLADIETRKQRKIITGI